MTIKATVTEVMRNFSDYLNRVAFRGERFVLTRGGKEVAELAPMLPAGTRLGDLPEILRGLPRLGQEEAEAFANELDELRERANREKQGDPWAS